MKGILITVLALCTLAAAARVRQESNRQGKVFSLFNIITFKNGPCVSDEDAASGASTTYRNGTCMTSDECGDKSGRASGNCASGFGVCCVISVDESGARVDQNATYIRNPNYPSQLDELTSTTYTIAKSDNEVCWIRLDFDLFTLAGPNTVTANTAGTPEGTCTDSMEISSANKNRYPTICGENTGQHMYIEFGDEEEGDTATLTFDFDTSITNVNRRWEIKALQVGCFSEMAPPSGCFQWETGVTGRFSTFNYQDVDGVHLRNQDYSYCIRQEYGHCCVQYQVCDDDPTAFTLDGIYNDQTPEFKTGSDSVCIEDYIGIEGATAQCSQSVGANMQQKFCGNVFAFAPPESEILNGVVCDCTAPFAISVVTDDDAEAMSMTTTNRGNCLEWVQQPC